ncbi:MAG: hypothetical protein MRZ79_06795 [Bacteroidia bacterium]|nr:hypothetical protein [Bacteroidia bacterium]
MKAILKLLFLLTPTFILLNSCSTEVDLNAPKKDIWVVYGVLDQSDSVQYIRVSRGFLEESDALEFARNTDLSERGLQVKLINGNREFLATEIDSVVKEPIDGVFFPYTALYKIETTGLNALETGETYQLEIRRGDDPDFLLSSQTTIPSKVNFQSPNRNHRPGPGGSRCLVQVLLENDFQVKFSLGNEFRASGLEIRAFLSYEENGIPKTASFGPTSMFTSNVGCSNGTGASARCYELREGTVLRSFFSDMDIQSSNLYTYNIDDDNGCQNDPDDLPRALRFEITGMDAEVSAYRRVNSPNFTDFNTVRPNYTNISGPDSDINLGLFGSISKESAIARLSPCGEYLLSLNGTPEPEDPCSL